MSDKAKQQALAQLSKGIDTKSRAGQDLLDRFSRWGDDLIAGLADVYEVEKILPQLTDVMIAAHNARSENLHQRDRERILRPDWFQDNQVVGYVTYTDLFEKNLKGLQKRIGYLKNLGVTYLHLMPLLKPRPGANDGGYAVMDYKSVRDDLGDVKTLNQTAEKLHAEGISLTLDLVLNHVAMEHEWARKAKAGDEKYRNYFYVYSDRTMPDRFEKTLPEVFPDFAPGNFTWDDELKGWVWTTFNSYQWDVNWSNPDVFCEYADIVSFLANQGVDCLRLDAIAFLVKREGTNCQNQPEVHSITQALRAFSKIVTPALIFKAEAIVGPSEVGAYLGEGKHTGKVSDLAYHNSLMVQIWSAIAAKDAKLFELTMSRFKAIPSSSAWGIYIRCHDDIGWAIDDADAHAVGLNGHDHRMFLADYYTGKFYESPALGEDFQLDEASGERRTSGTTAALTGIELATKTKNGSLAETALKRYLCAYAMVFGFGGIPLLYMGDEIGLLNDRSYLKDPAKAEDNRWLHRPPMDWKAALAAEGGQDPQSMSTRIRSGIQALISARKELPSLHAGVSTKVVAGHGRGVVIFERSHPAGTLVQVYNLSDAARWVNKDELAGLGGILREQISGMEFDLKDGFSLAPYQAMWLVQS